MSTAIKEVKIGIKQQVSEIQKCAHRLTEEKRVNWKDLDGLSENKFPFIEYCQVEPFFEPFNEFTYQAWANYLAYEIEDGALAKVYKLLGYELTSDNKSIGSFCDWITESYWGIP